jgi:hypothetical protein
MAKNSLRRKQRCSKRASLIETARLPNGIFSKGKRHEALSSPPQADRG